MDIIDAATIFRFHKEIITLYGAGSSGALGWKNTESQLARYEMLSQIANLENCSVLDAGCGTGDLGDHLQRMYPGLRYYGVELMPSMLEIALERYGERPDACFFQGDFSAIDLPAVDYVLASGSLSYRNSDPLYLYKMIEKLFKTCRRGFGFNLLEKNEDLAASLYAYTPAHVLEFCNKLTENASVHMGYCENDFTIFMYH